MWNDGWNLKLKDVIGNDSFVLLNHRDSFYKKLKVYQNTWDYKEIIYFNFEDGYLLSFNRLTLIARLLIFVLTFAVMIIRPKICFNGELKEAMDAVLNKNELELRVYRKFSNGNFEQKLRKIYKHLNMEEYLI